MSGTRNWTRIWSPISVCLYTLTETSLNLHELPPKLAEIAIDATYLLISNSCHFLLTFSNSKVMIVGLPCGNFKTCIGMYLNTPNFCMNNQKQPCYVPKPESETLPMKLVMKCVVSCELWRRRSIGLWLWQCVEWLMRLQHCILCDEQLAHCYINHY